MNSLILATAIRYLLPLLLLFSVFLLLRGHNEPGGGFVGGLVAAAAFALYAISHGVEATTRLLRLPPRYFIGLGLLLATLSGMAGFVAGKPFLSGEWSEQWVPVLQKIGTPLTFDIGVYLVVLGVVLAIVLSMAEEQ